MHTKCTIGELRLVKFRGNENQFNRESSELRQQVPLGSTKSRLDPHAWEVQADEKDKDVTARILKEPQSRSTKRNARSQQKEFDALTQAELAEVDALMRASADDSTKEIHNLTANTGSKLVRLEMQYALLDTALRVTEKKLERLRTIEAQGADILEALASPEKRLAMEQTFQTQLAGLRRKQQEIQMQVDAERKPLLMIEAAVEELENIIVAAMQENPKAFSALSDFQNLLHAHIAADPIQEKQTILEKTIDLALTGHPRLERCREILKTLRARKGETKRHTFKFWKTYERETSSDKNLLTWLRSERMKTAELNPPNVEQRIAMLQTLRTGQKVSINVNGKAHTCIIQRQETSGRAPMTRMLSAALGTVVINAGNRTMHYAENNDDGESVFPNPKTIEHFLSLQPPTVTERTGAMRAGFNADTIYFSAA